MMVDTPLPLRSSFRVPNARDSEHVKRMAFHDHGIAVIAIDDPNLSWVDKAELTRIAEKIYGKRRPRA